MSLTAKRDMTEAQFQAALKRAGFRNARFALWRAFIDERTDPEGTVYISGIYRQKGLSFDRRATIMKLHLERKKQGARKP